MRQHGLLPIATISCVPEYLQCNQKFAYYDVYPTIFVN